MGTAKKAKRPTKAARKTTKKKPAKRAPRSKKDGPWRVGKAYLIRTVTHYLIGILIGIHEHELELADASWVADTGRFSEALNTGRLKEVEPYPDGVPAIVGRGAIIDAGEWRHPAPRKVL